MANPISLTVATQARAAGPIRSADTIYPGAYTSAQIALAIPNQTDYENVANSFEAFIEFDKTGGTNYSKYVDMTWNGGVGHGPPVRDANGNVTGLGPLDPPIVLSVGLGNLPAGSRVRGTASIGAAMTIGFTLTINP